MKYGILSVGVMIGAYILIEQIANKKDSDIKEAKITRDGSNTLRKYWVEIVNEDGVKHDVIVNAVNRGLALESVMETMEYGCSITNMGEL